MPAEVQSMKNKKLSILIVDDNENYVRRMTDLLIDIENVSSIQTAGDYNEAFRMLDNKMPDVLLLDISLPGKSGINLLQTMRELKWSSEVIMVTNNTAWYYKEECKKMGVRYFLDKTSEFDKVAGIINSFYPN